MRIVTLFRETKNAYSGLNTHDNCSTNVWFFDRPKLIWVN